MKKIIIAALMLSGAWQSFAQNYQYYIDYSGYGEYDAHALLSSNIDALTSLYSMSLISLTLLC